MVPIIKFKWEGKIMSNQELFKLVLRKTLLSAASLMILWLFVVWLGEGKNLELFKRVLKKGMSIIVFLMILVFLGLWLG